MGERLRDLCLRRGGARALSRIVDNHRQPLSDANALAPTVRLIRIFRPLSAAAGQLAGAALLALLLTQSAALIHAIAHTPLSSVHSAQGGEGDRWGHEVDTLSCVVIDHLLAAQHIGCDAVTPQSRGAPFWLAPQPTASVARGALRRSYQARGPPTA